MNGNLISIDHKSLNNYSTFQRYFIEEFYDDYQEGSLSRRSFIRRLAYIS